VDESATGSVNFFLGSEFAWAPSGSRALPRAASALRGRTLRELHDAGPRAELHRRREYRCTADRTRGRRSGNAQGIEGDGGRLAVGPDFEARYAALAGGYTVGFETFTADADLTLLLAGLPDDRCQTPHWGYVIQGGLTYIGAREEPIRAGEALYVPGGTR